MQRWADALDNARRARRRLVELEIRPRLLRGRVTHVHGPAAIDYAPDELIVTTVVRNGASYAEPFVDHYRRLGAKHLVFLDNGSTDDTVARLSKYDGITVLATSAPYATFENAMKTHLAERFSRGRWNLSVDIDELFDYPFSPVLSLRAFLRYLNARGFTAVVTQMLDMFPDGPLALAGSGAALIERSRFYDLSNIEKSDYTWSEASNPAIRMHWGGIRETVFGTHNGLTKAALVRMDDGVTPFNEWHHATGARVADVSCVLRHYPFSATFGEKVIDAVRTGRYGRTTTREYEGYRAALEKDPDLHLKRETARLYGGGDRLIEEGFLVVSDEYRRAVSAASAGTPTSTRAGM